MIDRRRKGAGCEPNFNRVGLCPRERGATRSDFQKYNFRNYIAHPDPNPNNENRHLPMSDVEASIPRDFLAIWTLGIGLSTR
jgi:hypothetical protein